MERSFPSCDERHRNAAAKRRASPCRLTPVVTGSRKLSPQAAHCAATLELSIDSGEAELEPKRIAFFTSLIRPGWAFHITALVNFATRITFAVIG